MQDLFAIQYAWLIPLLPLIGAAICGFFGAKWLKGKSHWPIWLAVGHSAVMSLALLWHMSAMQPDSHGQPPCLLVDHRRQLQCRRRVFF
jgi:NADH:ubiquinone oxidoreductase subunit 5 (subunit L)/multisubunit Na+/H+ antiporter MnhA subunit